MFNLLGKKRIRARIHFHRPAQWIWKKTDTLTAAYTERKWSSPAAQSKDRNIVERWWSQTQRECCLWPTNPGSIELHLRHSGSSSQAEDAHGALPQTMGYLDSGFMSAPHSHWCPVKMTRTGNLLIFYSFSFSVSFFPKKLFGHRF
jgi:hypothetical protein